MYKDEGERQPEQTFDGWCDKVVGHNENRMLLTYDSIDFIKIHHKMSN